MGMFRKQAGVSGVVSNTSWDIKEWPGKNGGEPYSTLSLQFDFKVDGADEPQQRFVNAGFVYEGTSVSEDGKTLVNDEIDGGIVQEDSEFARFIGSLIAAGFPEADLDINGRNFESIEGTRIQLTNWVDEEATKKFGKRTVKKGPNKGKEYSRTELRVSKVYEAEAAKATAKPAAKAAASKKAVAAEPQDTERADTVIVEILADTKDNTVSRTSLSAAVVKYALKNKLGSEERDSLRKQLTDEAYLMEATERGVIAYLPKEKGQPVALSAVAA
jgi:hypothetical protein